MDRATDATSPVSQLASPRPPHRDDKTPERSSLNSLLEGNGFELSVPRCLATAKSVGGFIRGGER